MATWQEIEKDAPEFAERVRSRFAAGTNKTLATLRKDGSPRISGTELQFEGGEVTFGMMDGSRKLADVRRDPRIAVHSPTLEPPSNPEEWLGEAKMAGRAVQAPPPEKDAQEDAGYFRMDITEVALTYVGGSPADHLVIESWHEGIGYRRRTRK
jgi:pyridoxamine 5'-phosphate oxidase-like protein